MLVMALGAVCPLLGTESNIDEILSEGAGQIPLQRRKILIPLIFRHHSCAEPELGNDLSVIIDKAAINSCHIAAVPARMPPDLADLFFCHVFSSLLGKFARRRIRLYHISFQ